MTRLALLAAISIFIYSCSSQPQQEAEAEEVSGTTEETVAQAEEESEVAEHEVPEESDKPPFILSTRTYEMDELVCTPTLDSAMKQITKSKMDAHAEEISQYSEEDGPFEAKSYDTDLGDSTGRYAIITISDESCGATCSNHFTSHLVINMNEDGWCYREDLETLFEGSALKIIHLKDREQLLIFATDMSHYHIFAEFTKPTIYLLTLDGEQTIQKLNFNASNYCECLVDDYPAFDACSDKQETGGWNYSINSYDQEKGTVWFTITNLEIWRNEETAKIGDKVQDMNYILDLNNEEIRESY